jgi:hypothetical protein
MKILAKLSALAVGFLSLSSVFGNDAVPIFSSSLNEIQVVNAEAVPIWVPQRAFINNNLQIFISEVIPVNLVWDAGKRQFVRVIDQDTQAAMIEKSIQDGVPVWYILALDNLR